MPFQTLISDLASDPARTVRQLQAQETRINAVIEQIGKLTAAASEQNRTALREAHGRLATARAAALHHQGLIARGPRSPEPGAPYTYVTAPEFLVQFGLETLRDLPDLEALEDAGLLKQGTDVALDLPIAGEDAG